MQQHNNSSSSVAAVPVANQVSSAVLGLCFLFGMPGNIMVVVVILRNFKKDNFTLQLMLNLAAADILCLITLPLWIHYLLVGWTFSQAVCKLLTVFIYISVCSSVMTVTLMSVQRYIAVLYSQQWAKLGGKCEKALLFSLWLLACILSIPAAVPFNVRKEGALHDCKRVFTSDGQRAAIYIFETLLGFVAPFAILVTSYCRLHRKVHETGFFSSKRLTKLVTNILVTFFILWIPFHVLNIISVVGIALKSSHPALCKFLFFIVYTSLYACLLTVSLMSVQRFLMILYPIFWAKLGRADQTALLVSQCQTVFTSDREETAILLSETLLGFVAPFTVLVTITAASTRESTRQPSTTSSN
ncbi:leukotriene B4 receptor 1-like [Osmerus mordax]|uniref:leukotriene B4 receptor 1-like n=1 Tax=Osmerus mordax TaxID=8014 RepID=UPI00350F75FA